MASIEIPEQLFTVEYDYNWSTGLSAGVVYFDGIEIMRSPAQSDSREAECDVKDMFAKRLKELLNG